MNNKFSWAYRLTDNEIQDLFKRAEFFIDTNALLKVYHVNNAIASKVIEAIIKYKDRIHIPYHVAVEYHWNVIKIVTDRIAEVQNQISNLAIDKLFKKVFNENLLSYIPKDEQEDLKSLLQDFCEKTIESLNQRKKMYEEEFNTMTFANTICRELTGRLLEPLPEDEYANLRSDFAQRAEDKIPPGYLDNTIKKKNNKREGISNEAGDYIIWEELLRWAKGKKKDVIFVSDDLKEDWIWENHGFKIGPRWELKKQFFKETSGNCFHILTLDKFLELTENFTPDEIQKVKDAVTAPEVVSEMIKKSLPIEEIIVTSVKKSAHDSEIKNKVSHP